MGEVFFLPYWGNLLTQKIFSKFVRVYNAYGDIEIHNIT